MLRDFYSFIQLGYHMNKKHWISIHEDINLDKLLVNTLIHESYDLVCYKLSKLQKQQLALLKSML